MSQSLAALARKGFGERKQAARFPGEAFKVRNIRRPRPRAMMNFGGSEPSITLDSNAHGWLSRPTPTPLVLGVASLRLAKVGHPMTRTCATCGREQDKTSYSKVCMPPNPTVGKARTWVPFVGVASHLSRPALGRLVRAAACFRVHHCLGTMVKGCGGQVHAMCGIRI